MMIGVYLKILKSDRDPEPMADDARIIFPGYGASLHIEGASFEDHKAVADLIASIRARVAKSEIGEAA